MSTVGTPIIAKSVCENFLFIIFILKVLKSIFETLLLLHLFYTVEQNNHTLGSEL